MPDGFRLGAAFIQIDPDLTGFHDKLQSELDREASEVKVRVVPDSAGFKARLKEIADSSATGSETKVKVRADGETLKKDIVDSVENAADPASDKFSKTFTARTRERIKQGGSAAFSFMQSHANKAGFDSANSMGKAFIGSTVFGKNGAIVTGVGSLLATLPALGAIAGSGMVIALGAKIAATIPGVKKEFQSFGKQSLSILQQSVGPMVPYITRALSQVLGFLKQIEPQLKQLFAAAGPLIQPFLNALELLIKNLLPGFTVLLKSAAPALSVFGQILGTLGKNITTVFTAFAPVIRQSAVVLRALLDLVSGLLPIIAHLAAMFATTLGPVIVSFTQAFEAITPTINIVAKVLSDLAGAVLTSLAGTLVLLGQLLKGISPGLNAVATAFGQVFSVLENSGILFVVENALAAIVKPLTQLINGLLLGLAPILPQVINLFAQLLALLAGQLGDVLLQIVNLLLPLVPVLVAIVKVVVELLTGALHPLLPVISALIIAWYALNIAMSLNPFVLIVTGIVLLVALIVKFHKQIIDGIIKAWDFIVNLFKKYWKDILLIFLGPIGILVDLWMHFHKNITDAVMTAWNFIENLFKKYWKDILLVFTGPIGIIIDLFRRFHSQITSAISNAWNHILGFFKSIWGYISGTFQQGWSQIVNGLRGAWNTAYNDVVSVWNNVRNFFTGLWSDIVGGAEQVVKTITSIFSSPVNTIKHVFSFIPGLAGGGVIPGYAPGKDTVMRMLSPGEGVLVPEAVRAIGGKNAIDDINYKYAGYRGAGSRANKPGTFAYGGIMPQAAATYSQATSTPADLAVNLIKSYGTALAQATGSAINHGLGAGGGAAKQVNINFYGPQYPTPEQIANLRLEMSAQLQVVGG